MVRRRFAESREVVLVGMIVLMSGCVGAQPYGGSRELDDAITQPAKRPYPTALVPHREPAPSEAPIRPSAAKPASAPQKETPAPIVDAAEVKAPDVPPATAENPTAPSAMPLASKQPEALPLPEQKPMALVPPRKLENVDSFRVANAALSASLASAAPDLLSAAASAVSTSDISAAAAPETSAELPAADKKVSTTGSQEPAVLPAALPAAGTGPLPAADLADLNRRLDELTDTLEAEVRRRRTISSTDELLPRMEQQLRLMYLIAGRTDHAVAAIESLSEAEREAYKHLLFGLSTWLSEGDAGRSAQRNAKVLRSLREAATELAPGSKLDLRNLAFCEKVDCFGWYTEFSRREFKPQQQVVLYVEVDNFAAEEAGPQRFITQLQGSYQIFDSAGRIVAERKLPLDREECRVYRRDYFLAYLIYMPTEIAAGNYRLELTIEDLQAKAELQGRKLGQAMIDFSIRL